MVIDFSNVDIKKRPKLILKNLDETAIGYLGCALHIQGNFNYNSVSEISFEYPSQVDGMNLPEYDLLTSMRIVDMQGYGIFILRNPSETNNGIVKIKSCTAYSLEYEFTYKMLSLEEGTYNFWNPMTPESTILGLILSEMPSWSIGTVSTNLIGKYRTFSIENQNIYDLMKSQLQETYQCVFDFDTYNREINVRSIEDIVRTQPIYLSTQNLIKEIQIDENTDDLVTVLDVNGAEGVNIRPVNPLGTNYIYNLDNYMNDGYFSSTMISKWNEWKEDLESVQDSYSNYIVLRNMQITKLATANAKLTELQGELSALEISRNVINQTIAITDSSDPSYQTLIQNLATTNQNIDAKETEISAQKTAIQGIETAIENYTTQLNTIIRSLAFNEYFNENEITLLNRFFKYGSVTDSTFVATSSRSYASSDIINGNLTTGFTISGADSVIKSTFSETITFYSISGGTIITGNGNFSAKIVNGTIQENSDDTYIMSFFLSNGTANGTDFESGTLSVSGTLTSDISYTSPIGPHSIGDINDDGVVNATDLTLLTRHVARIEVITDAGALHRADINQDGEVDTTDLTLLARIVAGIDTDYYTGITFTVSNSTSCLTQEVSNYQQLTVEQELYEYGKQCLEQLSSPAYTFSIQSANFLALDDFVKFAKNFTLGNKLYLDLSSQIIQPIVLSANIDFDDFSSLSLTFSDVYHLTNVEFTLEDILDTAISMGKNVELNQFNYNNFVNSGAQTNVRSFMQSALDTMKNRVLAGTDEEITIDQTGIRLRKYDSTSGTYDDEQVWMASNAIMFTNDGWDSAVIGIGKFKDKNVTGSSPTGEIYGVVAPAIVGTILAGENLVIESEKQDGSIAVFKVDSSGASLHNASFDLFTSNGNARINLDPNFGIIAGLKSNLFYLDNNGNPIGVRTNDSTTHPTGVTSISGLGTNEKPNSSFWLDMNGEAYFSGTVYATSGSFSGDISAATGTIGGWTIDTNSLHSGSNTTYVSLNSGSGNYAIWAGGNNASTAPFSVQRDGTLKATSGSFAGTLDAPLLTGNLTASQSGGWLVGSGIAVGGQMSGDTPSASDGYKFFVDQNGNVNILGNLTLASGSISWNDLDGSTQQEVRDAQDAAAAAQNTAEDIAAGNYTPPTSTFINGTSISSPTINGASINGCTITGTVSIKGPDIYGGAFHAYNPSTETAGAYMTLGFNNDGYGDLNVFRSNGISTFRVSDYITSTSLSAFGTAFLNTMGTSTTAQGDWSFSPGSTVDFTGTTVTGLTISATNVTAVWG